MTGLNDSLLLPRAAKPLDIIIVGAGIAGLSTAIGLHKSGHSIVILEQVHEIGEVGAGIQIAPNAARILRRFGLLEQVMQKANVLEALSLRRWENDEVLGSAKMMPEIGEKYKAPLAVIHRGDLQSILLRAVEAAGIKILLNSKVVAIDRLFSARVQISSGEWLTGDVVIGADGIKSSLRSQMASCQGINSVAVSSGDSAYRVLIPKEAMAGDDEALACLATNTGMRWMGPGGHIMAYPIKQNTVYNMVLLHPSSQIEASNETECWVQTGSRKEMLAVYKDWNPVVRNLLSYVPEGDVLKWTLNTYPSLPTWIENRCVLVGDACHPMLPYVAQGAAQAIEDAGVLACVFSLTTDIDMALRVYEAIRKSRAEQIQNSASRTRTVLHLEDGMAQTMRDRAMGAAAISVKEDGIAKNPDLWADSAWQDFMWGEDVMKDALENWELWEERVR